MRNTEHGESHNQNPMKYPEDNPNFDPDQILREAVSLSGDDLSTWQVHVTGLRGQDTFLNLAMKFTET